MEAEIVDLPIIARPQEAGIVSWQIAEDSAFPSRQHFSIGNCAVNINNFLAIEKDDAIIRPFSLLVDIMSPE